MNDDCNISLINTFYYIWTALQITMESSILVLTIPAFLKEIRNKYLSNFKIIQCVFTFIGASSSILLRLCLIVFWKKTILFLLIYRLAIYTLFYFQFSIQMCWLMMMLYLKYFKIDRELALRDNSKLLADFDHIKRKLRRIEILLRSCYITYVCICTFCMLFIIFSQIYSNCFERFDPNNFCKFTIDFSNVFMYIEECTQILFIVIDCVLFYFIIKMMRTNLNHYYRVNKKKWVILAISNLLFFSCSFINSILINHYNYNIFIVYYQGNCVIISSGDTSDYKFA